MAEVTSIVRDYFGVTLYVTPRGNPGKSYACRAWTWKPIPGGGLEVQVQTWPGYGRYKGKVRLTPGRRKQFEAAQKQEV